MGIRVKHSSAPAVPLDVAYDTGLNNAKERHLDRALKLRAMQARSNRGGSRGRRMPLPQLYHAPKRRRKSIPPRELGVHTLGGSAEFALPGEDTTRYPTEAERVAEFAAAEEQQKEQMSSWFNRGQGERERLRQLQQQKQQQVDALENALREGKMRMTDPSFQKAMGMIEQNYGDLDTVYIPNEEDEMRFAEQRKPYQLDMNGKQFGFDSPKEYFDAMKVKSNAEHQAARVQSDYYKQKMDWMRDNQDRADAEFEALKEKLKSDKAPIADDPAAMMKLKRDIELGYAEQFDKTFPPPIAPGMNVEDMAKNPSVAPGQEQEQEPPQDAIQGVEEIPPEEARAKLFPAAVNDLQSGDPVKQKQSVLYLRNLAREGDQEALKIIQSLLKGK